MINEEEEEEDLAAKASYGISNVLEQTVKIEVTMFRVDHC
jgi:hypothetical protein